MTPGPTKCSKGNNQTRSARLFFAIQPPKTIQTMLGDIARKQAHQSGGRSIKPENIHLTLLFLGQTPIDRVAILETASNEIIADSFELTIQRTCYWKHNQIIYASANSYPPALFSLVDTLKATILKSGFKFDDRKYKPHITLVRKATQHTTINLQHPIQWHVTKWCLMQSIQTEHGIQYRICNQWQLG